MSEAKPTVESLIAVPGRFRWETRARPLFDDGLWWIMRDGGPERLPVCTVDRGDDHDATTRAKAAEYALLFAATT